MDVFTQKKMLLIMVIVLTIINLASTSFFLWNDSQHQFEERIPNEPNIDKVKAILKQKLDLTAQQTEQMSALRLDFYTKEKVLSKIIRAERDSMNDIMFNKNTNEYKIKQLARNVADNEYKMEMLRFEQAKSMKAICSAKQLEKFEDLVKEIRDYFKSFNQNKK